MKTTLLITTFNRGNLLERSLERLTHLTLPDEILIVDDGSNRQQDATEWIAKGYSSVLPIRYIYNNNPTWTICSMARNIGLKQAIGNTIITAEPEMLFVTDIVKQMLEKADFYPNHVISVGTVFHMQERATIGDLATENPFEFLKTKTVEDYQIEPRPYDPEGFVKTINLTATFCALYRKEWLYAVGGWDEAFPGSWGFDDHDLLTRLRIRGYNQVIDNAQQAIHQWHPHLPPHIQGPMAKQNEDYLLAKKLNEVTSQFDSRLIANKGKEWGVIR